VHWFTSSYSGGNTDCVEVATTAEQIGVRDSKRRAAGHLTIPAPAWTHFLTALSADNAAASRPH
jgi:hypothetical protein